MKLMSILQLLLSLQQALDGFIAPIEKNINEPFWISNTKSRQLVHKWRSEEQAILVGAKTIREDDPRLTTRDWEGKNCEIYILSKNGFKKDYKIFNQESKVTTLNNEKIDFKKDIVKQMCDKFYDDKILSIIVEGGSKTLSNFIDSETWDEMRVFKTKEKLGDGIKGPNIKLEESKKIEIGDNELVCYENKGVTFSNI